MSTDTPSIPLTPFIVALMERSARDTAYMTNAVTDFETRRAERAEATLWLIREAMQDLLAGPWMPTSGALLDALYPTDKDVKIAMAHKKG